MAEFAVSVRSHGGEGEDHSCVAVQSGVESCGLKGLRRTRDERASLSNTFLADPQRGAIQAPRQENPTPKAEARSHVLSGFCPTATNRGSGRVQAMQCERRGRKERCSSGSRVVQIVGRTGGARGH